MSEVLVIIAWLKTNSDGILAILLAIVPLGEAITRMTPTEADDGFVKRLGGWIDKLLSWLPNNLKKPELPK